MERIGIAVWMGALALGCGDGGDKGTSGGDKRVGSLSSPCEGDPRATELAWDETSALGVSASEAFSAVAGSCRAAFTWDAEGAGASVAPLAGSGQIEVSVTLDESSARMLEPPGSHDLDGCQAHLEVEADLRIESADGNFADEQRVVLHYSKPSGVQPFGFQRKASELGGKLRISPARVNQEVALRYSTSGAQDACAGEVQISLSETRGNMSANATGVIGKWSNSGCPLGQEAVRLNGNAELGQAFVHDIETAWRSAKYAGVWDDGAKTMLSIGTEIDTAVACSEISGLRMVSAPVSVFYESDDGRITGHLSEAHVNAFRNEDGSIRQLQLILDEPMVCDGPRAFLAYRRASCDDWSSVRAQLTLNHDVGAPALSGGKLEVYKYQGADMSGAADGLDTLTLEAQIRN